jgi:5'-nucleotidase
MPAGMMKKILYIDMDNVLVDFKSAIPRLPEETKAKYDGHLDDIHGIYSLMDPMPGAIEAYITLADHFDTYILSTSPWENPSAWSDKLNWVKKHLGKPAYKRLILTHHKNLNTGHFLIDDRIKNGVDRFIGEHIHFGSEKFPDWGAVVQYLLDTVKGT